MRGRAFPFLLLLLLSTSPAFPQCSWTPRDSAQFRTTALDVAIDGDFVWLATGYGVQLLDQSNPPRILASLALPGNTRVVEPDGHGLAYVGSGSRIYVLRRDGSALSIVRFVDAGANINDLLLGGPSHLFAATTAGIVDYDVVLPLEPFRTNLPMPSSSPNVTSLATASGKLYAADGDATVEVFSVSSIPQHTGEIATLPLANAVHAGSGGTLFVSDALGRNTDVFSGTTKIASLNAGANSLAITAPDVLFIAGPDRTLRAVNFTPSAVTELFEHRLAPTGGTDNIIHAIARANDNLYVAAGDIGLAVFDLSSFAPPYPLASYQEQPSMSALVFGDRAWFADADGKITEKKIVASGLSLTTERTWTGGRLLHDADATTLLASNGATATLWSHGQTPTAALTSTFAKSVKSAAIRGSNVVAVLDDGSVWVGGSTPSQVTMPKMSFVAREGGAYAFLEIQNETTAVHFYTSSDFTAPARSVTVTGLAIGGLAFNGAQAAVFTFNGVNVIDRNTGAVRVITDSNTLIPRQIVFSGDDLLVLDDRRILVYDDARTLVREQFLPANAVLMDAQPSVAVVATNEGSLAVSYLAEQPDARLPFASAFYTKVVTGGDRVYLLAPGVIDVYTTINGLSPHYSTGIHSAGLVDIAASDTSLYTVSAAGVITAYSKYGALLAQTTLNEGQDAQPLSIDVVGKAVWVSLTRGCSTGVCQKKTLVFDPASLAMTGTMTGSITDVVTSGTRAYALVDSPLELRALNIADPLHPAPLAAITPNATATSVATIPGHVYVIGDKLYDYSDTTLAAKGTQLTAANADPAQQIRVEGNCAVITARAANPLTYNATTFAPATTFDVPAPARSIAQQAGRLFILTTHSLEMWAAGTVSEANKRRAAR